MNKNITFLIIIILILFSCPIEDDDSDEDDDSNITAPSSLSYNYICPSYLENTSLTITSPDVEDGTIGSFTFKIISGILPDGLSLNKSSGEINGTPAVSSAGSYPLTVRVSNSAGSANDSITIVINSTVDAPAGLLYLSDTPTYTVNSSITINLCTLTSGTYPITYVVFSGSLPVGLSLNSSTGAITGTPTTAQASTAVTIRASNGSGNSDKVLNITVVDAAPSGLSYTNDTPTYTVNSAITANTASLSAGTGTITYSVISGSLPSGLSLNSSTGAITGTPTTAQGSTAVTIRASNSSGNTDKVLNITVVDAAPSGLSYANDTPTYTVNSAITTNSASLSAGTGTITYSVISGSLPSGLSLNSSTGAITGTPTAAQASTAVTIRASNGSGDTDKVLNITVNDAAPSGLSYSNNAPTYTVNSAITANTASLSAGTGTITYSVQLGSLPSGLSLNSSTGAITGTPTAAQASTAVTIRASNGSGNSDRVLNITVNDAAPSGLSYTNDTPTYTVNVAITTNSASLSSGTGTITYSVYSGSLPSGLSLNSSTGAITGTPTAAQASTAVTIRASNGSGNSDKVLNITVNN